MVKVINVRFEHHRSEFLGIGTSTPRISWSFDGDERDWFQHAYEVHFEHHHDQHETFKVEFRDNVLVPWPGRPLVSGQRVAVKVRVADGSGSWSAWSDVSTVEAGLLSNEAWKCSLIEASSDPTKGPHRPVVFRHSFDIPTRVIKARLYMTAHGVYVATLNGTRIGDHILPPGWTSYSHRLCYQTFDVTSLLLEGSNILEVTVAEGWYCGKLGWSNGRYNIYGDRVGLIGLLVLEDDLGKTHSIGTDNQWQWAYGPFITAGIYDGVTYDATQAPGKDTQWQTVRSRPITDTIVAPEGPPVKAIEELHSVNTITTPSGKTILDFGQNMVGWVKVRVDGPRSHKITFRFAEVLEHGELGTRPLRTAKATDVLILYGNGLITWEPGFTFHGFRYVEVNNWPGELRSGDITGSVIHSDMKTTGTFNCSNKLLNKLHENVVWGTQGNFVSIPTDCPQRDERLGWTGDINMFSSTANFLFDTSGLLHSWLTDLKLEQMNAHGVVPLVIPNIYDEFTKDAHAIWGDVAIMLPYSLYLAYGDKSILEEQYDSMKTWLKAIPRRDNMLWNYTAEWKLADWLDPKSPPEDPGMATTDPTHVSDAFLVHVTNLMAMISAIVGNAEDESRYSAEATTLRKAFADEYITPSGLLADNTQTAISLALAFDLFANPAQRTRAAEHLEQIVRRNARFHIATGFAGTPYVGRALTSVGKSNIFYRMLLSTSCPSWLYPVTMSATTVWERWDSMLPDGSINPGQMTSFNHYAFGAVAGWMHENILGLQIREPGWKVFDVKIVPGGNLKWAEGTHETPYGLITVRWRIDESEATFKLDLRVPPNTTAHVHFPGTDGVEQVGSGQHTWRFDYVDPGEWPPEPIIAPGVPVAESELAYFDEVLPCPWIDSA